MKVAGHLNEDTICIIYIQIDALSDSEAGIHFHF